MMSSDNGLATISIDNVVHTLREVQRDWKYSGRFEPMLAFASELTGIPEDGLMEMMDKKRSENEITLDDVRECIEAINLDEYDLGGCEVGSDDDCMIILDRVIKTGRGLADVVHEFLLEVREVLDDGLEDLFEEDEMDDIDCVLTDAYGRTSEVVSDENMRDKDLGKD